MKVIDIRNMTKAEIVKNLSDGRDEHFKLRLRRSGEELPNPLRLRLLKRDIARMETILREIELKGEDKVLTLTKKTADKKNK